MQALDGIGVATGWALIITMALACYYGIPFLIGFIVRSVRASAAQDRLERERIQEDLDDLQREHLFSIVASEHHKDEKAG